MLKTEIMNDKDITLSIKYLKKALSKKVFTYEHADPIEQNCYISSAGCIIGLYFPNTKIMQKRHPSYNVCSLSKVGGVLGVVYSLKEECKTDKLAKYFEEFIFESFEQVLYPVEFGRVREHIQRNRQAYAEDVRKLENIKRVYKKDGGNFARFLDNFKGGTIELSRSYMDGSVMSFKIGGFDGVYLYRDNETAKHNPEPTADELEELIAKKKESLLRCVAECDKDLKNLEKDFEKFEKITKELKDFLHSVNNIYAYKEQIASITL